MAILHQDHRSSSFPPFVMTHPSRQGLLLMLSLPVLLKVDGYCHGNVLPHGQVHREPQMESINALNRLALQNSERRLVFYDGVIEMKRNGGGTQKIDL